MQSTKLPEQFKIIYKCCFPLYIRYDVFNVFRMVLDTDRISFTKLFLKVTGLQNWRPFMENRTYPRILDCHESPEVAQSYLGPPKLPKGTGVCKCTVAPFEPSKRVPSSSPRLSQRCRRIWTSRFAGVFCPT